MKVFNFKITPETTLNEAKEFLVVHYEIGDPVPCPCCTQLVKKYKRKLSSGHAVNLIKLVKLYLRKAKYYHVTDIGASTTGGEFAQLRRWGLIAQGVNEDTKKRASGLWVPTLSGIDFVKLKTEVPRYCYTFNNKTKGFSEEMTNIIRALGDKFSYQELMENDV